ncbi:MAG TPA: acyltransferase [Acidimicrobiales bacterium]|nr:acyltransferase [Acidimicrobiales bacterium]
MSRHGGPGGSDMHGGHPAGTGTVLTVVPEPAPEPPAAEPERSHRLREVAGGLLGALEWTITNTVAGSRWVPARARYLIYRLVGLDVHTVNIAWRATFATRQVTIGRNAVINWGVTFDGGPIEIGDNSTVGQQAMFVTHRPPRLRGGGAGPARPIRVGADCWIGPRVVVVGDVSIADRCVVDAGSVVTFDLEESGVYAGCPARLVRNLAPLPRGDGNR